MLFRDEALVDTELAAKLEPAFLSGLRCIQPQIRSRFMEVSHKISIDFWFMLVRDECLTKDVLIIIVVFVVSVTSL